MTAGELLDDAEITPRVWQRLLEPDAAPGFVLDGFPRDVAQADALEAWLAERGERLDAVVLLDGDRDELVQRLLERARREDRPDDNPATIARRLDVYETETAPLVDHYAQRGLLRRVDGSGALDDVAARVEAALSAV